MAADGGAVGRGGSGARYMTDQDGDRWIVKANFFGGQPHRYLLLNEAVSAQVAFRLGVRVPEIAIVELSTDQLAGFTSTAPESARFIIGSRLVNPAEALSPDAARFVSSHERAGVVTLDGLVWNSDRQLEHVLVQEAEDGPWPIWAIDHGHTLATGDSISGHLDAALPAVPAPSLLSDGLTPADIAPWVDAAQSIRRVEYYEMVQALPGSWIVEPDAPDTIADALFQRAKGLADLVCANLT
jgi:hypothetical protein